MCELLIFERCLDYQVVNLTFEYPLGQKTMQQIIFNGPHGVVTIKNMWRKDSYCGRWYTGRK